MATLRFAPETCRIVCNVNAQNAGQFEARDRVEVRIELTAQRWVEFAAALGEISSREGSELRTEFPEGWTIFWKIRDGESRFFVAHPETEQWVATLALSPAHFEAVRTRMREGTVGPLSTLESVSRMSNVEVVVEMRDAG